MNHWLTIGMPTFDDYYGVLMTVQSLRLHHDLDGVELLVIDQNPGSQQGQATAALCRDTGVRYVPYTERLGTAPGKNAVFANALGEVVMCIDSHVMLAPTALSDLRELHTSGGVRGLIQGPMLMDNLQTVAVGLTAEWGDDVKGKWVIASRAALDAAPDLTPIVSQGGGLYVCRKDEWVGFHPDLRGFGGEEWVIQEKFRQAGLPVRLHKSLLWWHRFDWTHKVSGAPSHRPYPVLTNDKCRNYLIGFRELGLPADEVREHFLGTMNLPHDQYHRIVEDLGYGGCSACNQQQPVAPVPAPAAVAPRPEKPHDPTPACGTERADVMAQWYAHLIGVADNPNAAAMTLVNRIARDAESVYEQADKPGDYTIAILAAHPKVLRSRYSIPGANDAARLYSDHASPTVHSVSGRDGPSPHPKGKFDLAVVHSDRCEANHVYSLLSDATSSSLATRIVVLGTGDGGPGRYPGESCVGGPGILPAVRRLLKTAPRWSVTEQCLSGIGALVLSRDPADLPKLPSIFKMAGNFAVSLTMHSLNGGRKVEEAEYNRRIELCTLCPFRVNDRCTACGCPVEKKAVWESSECPYGKW